MDVTRAEYQARCDNLQKLMHAENIDAFLLTSEPEIRYFSGFRSLFWQSPTRPWFLIIPASGEPIAIIPEIGRALMQSNWLTDIRTWSSPHPTDDGVSLLVDALKSRQKIALMKGAETHLRMPLADYERVTQSLTCEWVDGTAMIKKLRGVKSPAEIAILSKICAIASQSFADAPAIMQAGKPFAEVFRDFKISLLQNGAEDVPYLVGGVGTPSYRDIIGPPSAQELQAGDVLMLDTGATLQGYFCDFDRNYAIGKPDDSVLFAYEKLWQATEAGLAAARPGVKACDLFHAMNAKIGSESNDVGRFGHGLGIQLTEWPSFYPSDETVLEENMVLTLEPCIALDDGCIMVTEENIVIRDGKAELLSHRAPKDLPIIG